jgi:hypothetical protein
MKHIKAYGKFTDVHYKIFESTKTEQDLNDIYLDINDICLDLEDSGLDVSIKQNKYQSKSYLSIDIKSLRGKAALADGRVRYLDGNYFFDFNDDIQNTIIRINQYMRELGGFRAWYRTQGYSHEENGFVVTPDEKLRYVKNGLLISNTDSVLLIGLIFSK